MKKIIASVVIALICLYGASKTSAQIVDQTYTDGLYVNEATGIKKPMPMLNIRESDIMWKKRIWREIDFRQKMNQGFYYPTVNHEDWKNFITVILDGLKEGTIQAFEVEKTDEMLTPISYNKFMVSQSDTTYKTLTRPYPPYDQYDTMIISKFDPSEVMRVRVKEDWYFDKQRSQLLVRIIAICPVKMKDMNGTKVPQPMFWIPYESAREVFARAPFFNRSNSAAQLSYDEIFSNRMFDSYIYKEENVYDRSIKEYAQGIDAMLESERIKQSIIDFEQNLWEY
ncbi:MAG: gliding motility protein GldN [Bacteroidia bacterium]|nr:gliding motility protein GldN [Bacteroidia bacterium]